MSVSGRLRARLGMLVVAGVCLLGVTPASAAGRTGIGSGRLVPTLAAVVGFIGIVLGGMALSRSGGGIGNGRRRAFVAGPAGIISVAVGTLHAANSAGGFGTGNGLAGAIVAMSVGLIAIVLGGLVLARSHHAG
jgi:hypothetical protein